MLSQQLGALLQRPVVLDSVVHHCMMDGVCVLNIRFPERNLYVATAGQSSGADPMIYRDPLRTEQNDLRILNGGWHKQNTFSSKFSKKGRTN